MAKKDSTQKRLQKIRPPRVQMTYDVDIGGASEKKELPFVVGVLGNFSGNVNAPPSKLKERNFVAVDRDNFDEVLKGVAPTSALHVKNRLTDEGGELALELSFRSMQDFRPESVVRQVEPLKRLLEAREKLADLRNKIAGNEKLEDVLQDVLRNTEKLQVLKDETSKGAK